MPNQRDVFPHMLTAADVLGLGPSPWYRCTRPSCRYVYRSLAHVRRQPPPCPACQQPWLPCHVRVTAAQAAAMEGR